MPDGTCTVVALQSDRMFESVKREMKTNILHYHTLVTPHQDVYEFYYDDTGEWYGKRNPNAEIITNLLWFGPCIIVKVKQLVGDGDRTFQDVLTDEQAQNFPRFMEELSDMFT